MYFNIKYHNDNVKEKNTNKNYLDICVLLTRNLQKFLDNLNKIIYIHPLNNIYKNTSKTEDMKTDHNLKIHKKLFIELMKIIAYR